jgi:hypothetical protein
MAIKHGAAGCPQLPLPPLRSLTPRDQATRAFISHCRPPLWKRMHVDSFRCYITPSDGFAGPREGCETGKGIMVPDDRRRWVRGREHSRNARGKGSCKCVGAKADVTSYTVRGTNPLARWDLLATTVPDGLVFSSALAGVAWQSLTT